MNNIFVVILKYLSSIDKIDEHRPEHLDFLDKGYEAGIFIASGRQSDKSGGVIIAKALNKESLRILLKKDPFSIHNLALYEIYEFIPNKFSPEFKAIIDKL